MSKNIIVCARVGDGSEDNPYRPDTKAENWQVVEEREDEMVIEIIE